MNKHYMPSLTNTEILCLALGWQGGTVHQVAAETGLSVPDILALDRTAAYVDDNSTAGGWYAIRTNELDYFHGTLKPANQGNKAFWTGVIAGHALTLSLPEIDNAAFNAERERINAGYPS